MHAFLLRLWRLVSTSSAAAPDYPSFGFSFLLRVEHVKRKKRVSLAQDELNQIGA